VKGIPWSHSPSFCVALAASRLAPRLENRGSIVLVRRKGQGGLLAALAVGMALSGSPFACSSSAQLAGPGGACTLVTDCQDGLVCCNGNKGSLTCVASVSCLQPAGGGGADAGNPATGMGDDGPGGGDATSTPPTDATTPPDDTGTPVEPPDTGTVKPPKDAGKPEDTGTPEQEAAPPPPPPDSGSSPPDASGE
jgi:hypothetical protein